MKIAFVTKHHHRQYAWALIRTHCADYSNNGFRKRKITNDWEKSLGGFLSRWYYDPNLEERIPNIELFRTRQQARARAREINNSGYHYVVRRVEVLVKEL